MTVPDQTMSIKQIFENHRRQMLIPEVPTYYESQVGFTSEAFNMDKQDRIEFMRDLKAEINEGKQKFQKLLAEKQAKDQQELIEKAKEQVILETHKQTQNTHPKTQDSADK